MKVASLVISSLIVSLLFSCPSLAERGLAGYWSFDDASVCNPGSNLVLNPSFENGMENWKGSCPDGSSCSIDSTTSSDGTSSFKVAFDGDNTNFYQIYQEINAEPDTYYELRYWLKTKDMTHPARIEYLLYNGDVPIECEGSFCYAFGVSGQAAGTHDWQEFLTYFRTTHDTTKIKIRPRKYSDGSPTYGTVWWDNITLRKIKDLSVPDNSGNNNIGQVFEAVCTDGYSGNGFRFDGKNDRVLIKDSPFLDITGNITIDMWIKGNSSEQGRKAVYVFGKYNSMEFQVGRTGEEHFEPDLSFKIRNSENTSWYSENTLFNVLDGKWHNIVATFDGSRIQVFVDNEYKGETRVKKLSPHWFNNDMIFDSDQSFFIGSIKNSTGAFKGLIDEVKIYNRTTHHFGYGKYSLYEGDKVYIKDYSNYHSDDLVFTLLFLNNEVTIEEKTGTNTRQYVLNKGDTKRIKNTEVTLLSNNKEIAVLKFSQVMFPTPKYINITGNIFHPNEDTKIVISNQTKNTESAQIIKDFLYDKCGISVDILNDSDCLQNKNIILIGSRASNSLLKRKIKEFNVSEKPVGDEGFLLFSNEDCLILESNSQKGKFYGANAIARLLENGECDVLGMIVNDYPLIRSMRAFHFPAVVGTRINTSFIENYIKKLSQRRFNTLFLLIDGGDDGGMHVQLESHPEVSKPNALSKEELKDIINYAKTLHIQTIPQLSTVTKGHMLIGKSHPELMLNNYTLDFENPDTYNLVLDIVNEVADIFNATYFHIGNDELYGYVGTSVGTSEPIMTPQRFAEAVTRIHNNLSFRGIRSIMWGDMLLNPDDFPGESECHGKYNGIYNTINNIPNDIIIADWHYRYWMRKDFPSIDYFQNKGFDVLGAVWDNRDTDNYFSQYLALRQNTSQTYGISGTIWFPFNWADTYTINTIIDESAEAFWGGGTALNICTDKDNDHYYFESGGCEDMEGFLGYNDCDDSNNDVNPGAMEICGNHIDDDCDGYDISCSRHSADTNHNGCIETSEVLAFIKQWLFYDYVNIQQLIDVIASWKSGIGCIG